MAVGVSGLAGAGEGLFALRNFLPGELVSYFAGSHTFESRIFFPNQTEGEEEEASAYMYRLGEDCPKWLVKRQHQHK